MEQYLQKPNLPSSKISLAVADGRIPLEIEKNLFDLGVRIIKTKKVTSLYDAISYHPDIVINYLGGNEIVVAPNIHNSTVYSLEAEGFKILVGKKEVSRQYPLDIAYNAAIFGQYAVCNKKHTDEILLENFWKKGLKILDVKQGYAKCSICIIDEDIIVTSDSGIHNILSENNVKSLLITPGHIELFQMNYGFIGGASGKISSSEIGFLGDIRLHPSYNNIVKFLSKYGKIPVNLSKNKLVDLGTLVALKEYSVLSSKLFPV